MQDINIFVIFARAVEAGSFSEAARRMDISCVERLYFEGRNQVARYAFNDEFITPILKNVHGDSSGVRAVAQLWHSPIN